MNLLLVAALRSVAGVLKAHDYDPQDMLDQIIENFGSGATLDEDNLNPNYLAKAIERSVSKFNKAPDPITVYRGLLLKDIKDLDRENLGGWWTTDQKVAGDKTGGTQGQKYTLIASIKKRDINWHETIMRDIGNYDEYEIIPNKNAPLYVKDVLLKEKSLDMSFEGTSGH